MSGVKSQQEEEDKKPNNVQSGDHINLKVIGQIDIGGKAILTFNSARVELAAFHPLGLYVSLIQTPIWNYISFRNGVKKVPREAAPRQTTYPRQAQEFIRSSAKRQARGKALEKEPSD
ncbi:hypothetical protein FNV43_RR13092 [Rhamnella rubrinervis]|uniref:Uncharacterized protein n=1 Tax=Rhamnella rubrinervis TaxID=2594499 RepID=A0A8K0H0I1_9ROSA|nr:hypothetical protein FNV43_RR13092 [Rhamnella rubrinervis]